MKRYKYGLNAQNLLLAPMQTVQAVSVTEVAPGETVGGKVTVKTHSDTTLKPIHNRTYQDMYAFYVPYRLLYPEWPEFIAGKSEGPLPTTTTNDGVWLVNQPGDKLAFQELAYRLIWDKFFRKPYLEEGSTDYPFKLAPARPTTMLERMLDTLDVPDTDIPIDVAAETVSVEALRAGFSQDRFQKTRSYYGDKYTDYLAALGVEASWSILDEPELIGMKHTTMRSTLVESTADVGPVGNLDIETASKVGDTTAYWYGTNTLTLKRTFVPEHGLVMVVAVTKLDAPVAQAKQYHLTKSARSDFYSPEFEYERKSELVDAVPGVGTWVFPKYDEYRYGTNVALAGVSSFNPYYFARDPSFITAKVNVDYMDPKEINFFAGTMDETLNQQLTLAVDQRMMKMSPIRPSQGVHGVA